LARVVRSMEILGHALVDMREAPDAQVVLEVAMVRAVRPDLDSGMEALSERVSVLERSLSGGAAFPRPTSAPVPAPPPAPAPARSAADAPPPTADVGRRPSIGALRRQKETASSPPDAAAGPPVEVAPPDAPVAATPVAGAPITTPASAATLVDRDSLTEAWGDTVLRALPARAKALFSAGRFVEVDDRGAHFALPNAAHRDRCVDLTPAVEAALSAHFGSPVTLVLCVDDAVTAAAGPRRASAPRGAGDDPGGPGDGEDPEDLGDLDPSELLASDRGDADAQASAAQARLLEAFPGASEVAG